MGIGDGFGGVPLRLVGQDVNAWCEKHGLEPADAECSQCGAARKTTEPMYKNRCPGLIAPPCECGCDERFYCVIVESAR